MKLVNLIEYLQEIFAKHGNIEVDVVAATPRIEVEEPCGDVAYSPLENRVKVIGKSV